jgi:hypothetical protein
VDEEVAPLLKEARERARGILENERQLLEQLSQVLIEREVIEGKVLRRYADGDEPVPSKEQLERESAEKRNGQQAAEQRPSGPAIIPSRAAETQEVPPVGT